MKIGVFDSGLGGLVITKTFMNELPEYDYLYLGDTAHLPYGEKTSGRILKYTLDSLKYLIAQNCKLIIIACNTATSITLRYIQQKFIPAYAPDVKVLGVVIPTVETAIEEKAKSVGIIAISATVASHIYKTELQKLDSSLLVTEVATPQLVPLIEGNDFQYMENVLEDYLAHFPKLDSLILGCTHYPLIKEYCRRLLPKNVKVISQDELMGAKLRDYLQRHSEIETCLSRNAEHRFCVTKNSPKAGEVAARLIPEVKIKEVTF